VLRAAIAGICSVVALLLAPVARAAPTEPLGHAGRWITDAEGRVVVLHGFNTVPADEQVGLRDMGMGTDNARWLAENGFNTIRLGLYYARVEPQPGQFDDAYLEDYLRVQRELADEGIFTLLDMHQDQLSSRYGTGGPFLSSRGFPDWFLKDDGFPNTRTPYPGGYTTNPALNRAYDNLWQDFEASDGVSVHEHFVRGWQRIIERFRNRPRLLGYDIFNEPWPGTPWQSCVPGCPEGGFDQTLLTEFTRKLVAGARSADPEHLVFYEPNLLFDYGSPTAVGDPGDTNAGFTFHAYCLSEAFGVRGNDPSGGCQMQEELPFENAEAQSQRTGDALLVSEFGWSPAAAERMADTMDRHMVSWQYWDYYGDYENSLHVAASPALIRPYPQVVAGTPERWSFERETKRFELAYATRRAQGEGAVAAATAPGGAYPAGSRGEVFVPALHYPAGYRVQVRGAEVVSEPGARLLELASCAGADTVEVVITPEAGPAPARCPSSARLPCAPRWLRVTTRGVGPIRLGQSRAGLARRYRVVDGRRGTTTLCVRGGGRLVVTSRRGRIDLVATTARGHRTRRAAPGRTLRHGRIRGTRAVGHGLLVAKRGRPGRTVYGLKGRNVRFLAITSRATAKRSDALARKLKRLNLLR
jgi:endoglycosylceramidase